MIEDNFHISEMAKVNNNLVDFLKKAKEDSSDVISGRCLPFGDVNAEENLLKEDPETYNYSADLIIQIETSTKMYSSFLIGLN